MQEGDVHFSDAGATEKVESAMNYDNYEVGKRKREIVLKIRVQKL